MRAAISVSSSARRQASSPPCTGASSMPSRWQRNGPAASATASARSAVASSSATGRSRWQAVADMTTATSSSPSTTVRSRCISASVSSRAGSARGCSTAKSLPLRRPATSGAGCPGTASAKTAAIERSSSSVRRWPSRRLTSASASSRTSTICVSPAPSSRPSSDSSTAMKWPRCASPVSASQLAWRRSWSTWRDCSWKNWLTRPTIMFIACATRRSSGVAGSAMLTKRRCVSASA